MRSDAPTVDAYLADLPEERRGPIASLRSVVLEHLPEGFEEGMQYGMIGYYVPLERLPDTYNGEPLSVAALASQKRHMALYMMGIYGSDDAWFRERWEATGHKLNMGKSCVTFRRLDDVPLDVVAEAIARVSVDDLIAAHEQAHPQRR
jgi:hypothetical protein